MLKKALALIALSLSMVAHSAPIATYDIYFAPGFHLYPDPVTGDWEDYNQTGTAIFDDIGRLTLNLVQERQGQVTAYDGSQVYNFHEIGYTTAYFDGTWDANTNMLSNVILSAITTSCDSIGPDSYCEDYWTVGQFFNYADYPGILQVSDILLHFQPGVIGPENPDPNLATLIDVRIYNPDTGLFENEDGQNSYGLTNYQSVSAVPVPATAWLFGSGLISLVGFAKRKKA